MTPKEKAEDLVDKYKYFVSGYIGSSFLTGTEYPEQILSHAKQCALIAVEEIINLFDDSLQPYLMNLMNKKYWLEVKQEINNL